MNCVFVHVSSTFQFGAMRSDCLVQFSILNLFRSPMNCVFIHVSSTPEFGAMRSDCLVLFPILNLFSEPHELRFRSCVFHRRVWNHA